MKTLAKRAPKSKRASTAARVLLLAVPLTAIHAYTGAWAAKTPIDGRRGNTGRGGAAGGQQSDRQLHVYTNLARGGSGTDLRVGAHQENELQRRFGTHGLEVLERIAKAARSETAEGKQAIKFSAAPDDVVLVLRNSNQLNGTQWEEMLADAGRSPYLTAISAGRGESGDWQLRFTFNSSVSRPGVGAPSAKDPRLPLQHPSEGLPRLSEGLLATEGLAEAEAWWLNPRHRDSERFVRMQPDLLRRTGDRLALADLVEGVLTRSAPPRSEPEDRLDRFLRTVNRLTIPAGVPSNVVPFGRFNSGVRLDEAYLAATEEVLDRLGVLLGDTFFINYTGHQGAVGAALARRGVPVYWGLTINERIADALQSFFRDLATRRPAHTQERVSPSATAIMLEPYHLRVGDFRSDIDVAKLPDSTMLGAAAKKVIVLTEDQAGDEPSVDHVHLPQPDEPFRDYLRSLSAAGVEVRVQGVRPPG